jgi:DnaJ-class molecular chaperone
MVRINVICPTCEGQKKKHMTKYPQGQGTAWVVCPQCEGKGYIEAELIEEIHGTVYFGHPKGKATAH